MTLHIIFLLIGFVLGDLICYLILRKKLKTVETLDIQTIQKNQIAKQKLEAISTKYKTLQNSLQDLNDSIEVSKKSFAYMESQAKIANSELKEKLNNQFELLSENLGNEYQKAEEDYKQGLLKIQEELTEDFEQKLYNMNVEINETVDYLSELRAKYAAAVEENKRKEQMKQEEMFYRLQLSDQDLAEIARLHEVEYYLKDPSPLNTVIWKVYYENPYTDLIGRVFGKRKNITGIYRITCIEDGRCYVGQAVDVPERWRQHIKRGLGAEPPTKNKLYPAMKKLGPENFIFELLEECKREDLNAREDYWQDFYHAKDFGYSIK